MQEFVLNIRYIVRGLRHEGDRRAAEKKWSVGNIYTVISSLSVYLLENSVKFLFKIFLFHGIGLLVSYPPKKIRKNRTTDEEVMHVLRHWSPIYSRFALQLSFFLNLNPRLQRLRGPTVWDIFHGSLASHKCKSSYNIRYIVRGLRHEDDRRAADK